MKITAKAISQQFATLSAVALLGGGLLPLAQAQTSPVGSWDLVLSGAQLGLAQITFAGDFSLSGTEIITSRITSRPSVTIDVGRGGDSQRGDVDITTTNTPTTTTITNFYGRAQLTGNWTYDAAGHVIGVMTESGGANSITNGVSFRAVVRAGSRITMVGSRRGRTIHYKGVPLTTLADFSANFYDSGHHKGGSFVELFTLTPDSDPNSYDVVGVGPAYAFTGSAMVSAQKRFAFVTLSDQTTNGVLRSVTGPMSLTTGRATLSGLVENGDGGENNVSLRVFKQ